jgi:urea transport system permease protein
VFFALGGYAIAMHLKLAGTDPGTLPDFMQWSGLDTLPWWWAPFRNPAFAIGAVFVLPAIAAARSRISCSGGASRRVLRDHHASARARRATFIISQQQFTGGFNG